MADAIFSGVGVALLTLFDADGEVDLAATAQHAKRLIAEGVQALIVADTTGEALALSERERLTLVATVREVVSGDVPVIAGVGAASTRQAVQYAVEAKRGGADALLALSPAGSRRLVEYYTALVEAATLPVMACHWPAVSPPGIPLSTLVKLPVQGVKDSSGDPARLLQELSTLPYPLYVGNAALLAMAGPIGCRGAILAVANVEPQLCARAFAGDMQAQRALTPALTSAASPADLKRLTADRYGTSPVTRL